MLELLRIMNEEGVRSIIIGGYALAFLGQPRYTKDLDLWVDANQADRLLIAIFGRSIDLRDIEGLDPGGNQ